MSKAVKISILTAVIIAVLIAVYYYFIYKKSAQQIAKDLGLYTGDPLHDATLDNFINAALTHGGAIGAPDNNMEWELNDAANRLNSPASAPEDYWRVNNVLTPVGALLVTIDVTHDSKQEIVIPQFLIDQFDSIASGADLSWFEKIQLGFDKDIILQQAAELATGYTKEQIDAARTVTQTGEAYIPQTSLDILWGIFNNYKEIAEGPGALPTVIKDVNDRGNV